MTHFFIYYVMAFWSAGTGDEGVMRTILGGFYDE
jgi:hypothetical protein